MRIIPFSILLAAALLAADSAEAAPVVAAISAVAGLLTAGGIVGAIAQLALGLALSFGLGLIEKARAKKRMGQAEARGVTLEVRMGDDQPASFVVGSYATAGIRKYIGTWGQAGKTPNAYLTDVIELSCIPHPGFAGLWIDDTHGTILWDEPHPDGRGYPIKEYRQNGGDFAWVRFVDGTQAQADPWLLEKFINHPERPFKTTMIGRGIAFAVLTFRYNTELFGGLPSVLFEMLPMPFYDLRKDSTNGGNGPQRRNDPSTWAPTNNNAVITYNIVRGIYYGDEWVYGGQDLAAFRLPPSNWIAAANECDRLVDDGAGGEQRQFRCGYEIRLDMEPLSVIDDIRQGCNGRIAEVGGTFKMLVGAPGAAVFSFTDDDILVTADQSFEPFPSLSETHNGIEATYPEPAEKWAAKDAPARYSSTLEAEDGDRRLLTGIEFPAVPFGRQVQALMTAMIEAERRFRVHVIHLPPDAFPLEPNDVVSWTSARNSYEHKKFLVARIAGLPTFNQLAVLKEIDPSDYDPPSVILPTATGWLGPIVPPAQPMYGWQVEPASIADDAGVARRPSMRVSCAPDQDDVRQVRVQVRLKSSRAQVFDGQIAYDAPHSWILNGTFLPLTTYQARGRFVPNSSRSTDWSDWLDVTTPDVRFGDGDVYLPGMIRELQGFTQDATEWLRDGVRELIGEQQRIVRLIAEQDLANFSDKQTLRQELVARAGEITASYTGAIVAAAGPGSALVLRIESLEAKIPGLASASAVQSLEAKVTSVEGVTTAQATSISSLFAALGGSEAAINVRATTLATPSGYSARYGIEARTGGSGSYRSAAMYLDVPASASSPTRVVFVAEQFVIASGANLENPFIFSGGEAQLNVARVGTIRSGRLLSLNSKMDINLNNGTIEVYS
ncbi:phage tail protein [Sinorhizobium medicae]|uniref:phage tail protein n=1 Tax=Sinorhizobium medicae TaxID=110321 RepID=UPI0004219E24|nr:phage tail protein [Sinorhizobium medicae]RVQ76109.1 DUF1983 domain-containing protein [Sinorhizobium medicae]